MARYLLHNRHEPDECGGAFTSFKGHDSAPLLELFPMMPVMGNLTLVIAVVSYAGQLNLTATADQDACPDLEVFAEGVRSGLDDLARSALVAAS